MTAEKRNSNRRVTLQALPRGTEGFEVSRAVRRVAEAGTDFSWLSRGDTVLIKVAANSDNRYPATTSPQAVWAMARLLYKKGAGKVMVGDKSGVQSVFQDPGRTRGSTRKVMTQNTLYQAAGEGGAEVFCFEEAGHHAYFGERTVTPGHWKAELMLPDILNQVDHVVLLPRVSRHVLSGTTLGLKAAVGWLRDDSRLELHRDAASFLAKIAEINDAATLRRKLRFTLTDATKVQTTFGPDRGFAAEPDPGLIFASESLLAHDMVALGWLLWARANATPERYFAWYHDPYTFLPGAMNRAFVFQIWGLKALVRSETYAGVTIESVGSDPVLVRAAELWGGFPEIELEDVNGNLPAAIRRFLLEKAQTGAPESGGPF